MREVMSNPLKGFWSVSLVGEVREDREDISLESPGRSGDPAGLHPADPSENKDYK